MEALRAKIECWMRGSRSFFNAYKRTTTLVAKVGKNKRKGGWNRERERGYTSREVWFKRQYYLSNK